MRKILSYISVTAALLVCKCISLSFPSQHLRGVYFHFYDTLDSSLPKQADSITTINNLSPLYSLQTPLWPYFLVLRAPGYNAQRQAIFKKNKHPPWNGWNQLWQWRYVCLHTFNDAWEPFASIHFSNTEAKDKIFFFFSLDIFIFAVGFK